MSTPDWTEAHAREALDQIGSHINAVTLAVLVCPRDHKLARVVATQAGPLYQADVIMPRLHPNARKALGDRLGRRAFKTVLALHTAAYLTAMADARQEDRWPASCDCGLWEVPHRYVVEIAKNPPRKKRKVIDTGRVRRSGVTI